jgi:hypothetical protein
MPLAVGERSQLEWGNLTQIESLMAAMATLAPSPWLFSRTAILYCAPIRPSRANSQRVRLSALNHSHSHFESRQELVARAAATSTMQEGTGVILLVGVTGGTGGSVVNGLVASGVEASKLRVLTRSPQGAPARTLASIGVQAIAGDLDDENSLFEAMNGRAIDII